MQVTEANGIPTGVEAQDVRRGMRIKRRLSDDGYVTVYSKRKNRAGKIAITTWVDAQGGGDLFTSYHNPCETLYYFDVEAEPEPSPEPEPVTVLAPKAQSEIDFIESHMLPSGVQRLVRDLEIMAEHFERKGNDLRNLAQQVREGGDTWAPAGFENVASEYAGVLAHNSLGTTASVAREIATLTGYATLLTVVKPERHQTKEA